MMHLWYVAMASNVETDEQRRERLRRRERGRLKRERETDEEREAWLVNAKFNPHKAAKDFVCPL